MSNDKELIKKVIEVAKLESIHLKHSTADIFVPPEIVNSDLAALTINYSFNSAFDVTNKVLFSFVAVEVSGNLTPEAKEQNPELKLDGDNLFFFMCSFVARYRVDVELQNIECEAFTRSNALFNIYPFLREHISLISTKMGLPAIVLPLLKPYGQEAEATTKE